MATANKSKNYYRKMFCDNSAIMLLIDPHSGAIKDASVGSLVNSFQNVKKLLILS